MCKTHCACQFEELVRTVWKERLPTSYVNRADVNQDGVIDISDVNQIIQVQTVSLNVNDPVVMFYDNYLTSLI